MRRKSILNKLVPQLIQHEGIKLKAYNDSVGVLTVGIGHNCKANPVLGVKKVGDEITTELAMQLFEADLTETENQMLGRWGWMQQLDDVRYSVMLNMAFNMGVYALSGFKRTLGFVREGQYVKASCEMLDSKWAGQVGPRARELAEQMRTGLWQEQQKRLGVQ